VTPLHLVPNKVTVRVTLTLTHSQKSKIAGGAPNLSISDADMAGMNNANPSGNEQRAEASMSGTKQTAQVLGASNTSCVQWREMQRPL